MNYKIWNKKDKINNIDADYFIKDLSIRDTDGVFLVVDHLDEVQAIEIDRIIKGVYNLDANLTVEEVAQEYIRIKEEEKLQVSRQAINMEEHSIKKTTSCKPCKDFVMPVVGRNFASSNF